MRYTLLSFPAADFPHLEIGFGLTDAGARGSGFATGAVTWLVGYLFAGYVALRITAVRRFSAS
jgi:hypothetical protein